MNWILAQMATARYVPWGRPECDEFFALGPERFFFTTMWNPFPGEHGPVSHARVNMKREHRWQPLHDSSNRATNRCRTAVRTRASLETAAGSSNHATAVEQQYETRTSLETAARLGSEEVKPWRKPWLKADGSLEPKMASISPTCFQVIVTISWRKKVWKEIRKY